MPKFLVDIDMDGNAIIDLLDPVAPQDAATKAYVDALIDGLKWKAPVVAATVANGALATAYDNGSTVDGVVLVTGDRILIKDQTAPEENGIYIVAASGAPTRSSDANTSVEITQAAVFVRGGTVNEDTAWVQTEDLPVIGTDPIVFVQFGSGGGSGTVNKYVDSTVGDGASTTIGINHALGTQPVQVSIYDNSTEEVAICDVVIVDANNVNLVFATAPASNAYTCVVLG